MKYFDDNYNGSPNAEQKLMQESHKFTLGQRLLTEIEGWAQVTTAQLKQSPGRSH